MGRGGSDAVLICAGTLRGDTVYGPGKYKKMHSVMEQTTYLIQGNITLGDILEILPFEDPIVVLELDGKTIWEALEVGLSTWPAQEGYV